MDCISSKILSSNKYNQYNRLDLFLKTLGSICIIAPVFHFWPFKDSRLWQMFNVTNFCCGIAILFTVYSLLKKTAVFYKLPVSIIAYLIVNILSIGFAATISRPMSYTAKLILIFTGGLFLFQKLLSEPKILKLSYNIIAVTVSVSIFTCLLSRLYIQQQQFGFHYNVFKYGTYIGILLPLAAMYLLHGTKLKIVWAILIIPAGVFSVGSIGGIISIFTGLTVAFAVSKIEIKKYILLCVLISVPALLLSDKVFDQAISKDAAVMENDNINLRQRYIEYQAEINLLEKRCIIGTGPGSVNDYRSNFYYRLPKLNTLAAFDQNGYLATAAETGIIGLATFVWILIHYGGTGIKSLRLTKDKKSNIQNQAIAAVTVANISAFASALTANIFSSVQYNGILIVFVLLLSMISAVNIIYGDSTGEN